MKFVNKLDSLAMNTQSLYQKASRFAAEKHSEQKVPGSKANYLLHLSNVAMEILICSEHSPNFDRDFALQVALLHDVLEDTDTTLQELETHFGKDITEAVMALSKDESLPKSQQMQDSLDRIKKLRYEVWAVKLADRITNLQRPPSYWGLDKKLLYLQQARQILEALKNGNAYLSHRLEMKILDYSLF